MRLAGWGGGALAAGAVALLACEAPAPAGGGLPQAEFLVAAGDSTYWVRSNSEGMRVRSAPLLLTQADGRLYELFVTEEGAEYADASFATTRLWARDLARPDSVRLVADSTVLQELARWRRRHPQADEVDPADETLLEDPSTVVSDEVDIVELHGPYVTVEHLLDVDVAGGAPHRHEGRRFVLDVRTGARVPLAALVGASEAARVLAAAPPALRQLADSIRGAAAAGDERARAAAEVLDSFRFDSSGFGLTDVGRRPGLAFMVPGTGGEGEALALHLPPIPVNAPPWWEGVRATLPEWAADSSRLTWTPGPYRVVARPSGEEAVALVLRAARDADVREWPVATVPMPVYQFLQLDAPPLDDAGRRALSRAFDLSTAGGLVEQAAWRGRAGGARVRRVALRAGAR